MKDYFNIFTPDSAISSIEKFAGRQKELDKISDALQADGTSLVLYGNRGVGKSSLARQIENLAQGDQSVIGRLTHKPFKPIDFLSIRFTVDDSVQNVEQLITRLLTAADGLAPWLPMSVKQVVAKAGLDFSIGFSSVAKFNVKTGGMQHSNQLV